MAATIEESPSTISTKEIRLRLRAIREADVRYGRARLRIAREGMLHGNVLDHVAGYRTGTLGPEEFCWSFCRSRVRSATPTFSWGKADLDRVLELVTDASRDPRFPTSEVEDVAKIVADAAEQERDAIVEQNELLAQRMRGLQFAISPQVDHLRVPLGLAGVGKIQLPPGLRGFSDQLRSFQGVHEAPEPAMARNVRIGGIAQSIGEHYGREIQGVAAAFSRRQDHLREIISTATKERERIQDVLKVLGGRLPADGVLAQIRTQPPKNLGLVERSFPKFGFDAPGGRLQLNGTALRMGSLSVVAGLSGSWIGRLREQGLLIIERFKLFLPANWRGLESDRVDVVVRLMEEEGLGLAWVPRPEVLEQIIDALDHEARCSVLLANKEAILEDIENLAESIEAEDLHVLAQGVLLTIKAYRDGYAPLAQTQAAGFLGEIVHGVLNYEEFRDYKAVVRPINPRFDVTLAHYPRAVLAKAVARVLERMDKGPIGFNRARSVHRFGLDHSEPNLVMALMLVAGLLRDLDTDQDRGLVVIEEGVCFNEQSRIAKPTAGDRGGS